MISKLRNGLISFCLVLIFTQSTLQAQHTPAEGRHNDRANVGFVDGHAETMTLEAMGYVRDEQGVIMADHPDAVNDLWSHTKAAEP